MTPEPRGMDGAAVRRSSGLHGRSHEGGMADPRRLLRYSIHESAVVTMAEISRPLHHHRPKYVVQGPVVGARSRFSGSLGGATSQEWTGHRSFGSTRRYETDREERSSVQVLYTRYGSVSSLIGKFQIPISKSQIHSNFQIPNTYQGV